jgi:NAD(P)-dependent dehydrogenase (short-subunit alcohol dehydrogenase family)
VRQSATNLEDHIVSNKNKVAVVTGANRGLGFEVCRQFGQLGFKVVLTARNAKQGNDAAQSLSADGSDVRFHPLDVTNDKSIQHLAAFIEKEFGQLDVLINNAGIFLSTESGDVMNEEIDTFRQTLETNTLGPLNVIQKLVPLMQREGRVVNLSSGMGQLTDMGSTGSAAYRMSKTALNVVTCLAANAAEGTNVKVNSVCPGWVRTDMGGDGAPRSPEQGVKTVVWLATLPDDGPSGGNFRDQKSISW